MNGDEMGLLRKNKIGEDDAMAGRNVWRRKNRDDWCWETRSTVTQNDNGLKC